jgi:heterodisulfide reductase subunit C
MAEIMDATPRKLVGLVSAGMGEKALSYNTIWECASCYFCTLRCPQDIPLTDVIYALKREMRKRHPERFSTFYNAFTDMIRSQGRVNEAGLMMKLAGSTPVDTLMDMASTGTAMVLKKRLPLSSHAIRGASEMQKLWRFAQENKEEERG